MSTYSLEFALSMLRSAIDFAEMEGDFTHARKWVNEVEQAAMPEIDPEALEAELAKDFLFTREINRP